ncbi:MAG: peptide deformylase [Erysipelotrichaceae bacterium]|nr:peptide deformylase [Erysipelotrichaceae bacterium]
MLINKNTIIPDTDPIIRTHSEKVTLPLSAEDRQLMEDMYTYVKESTDPEIAEKKELLPAVGISAIQVGVPKQMTAVIVRDLDKNDNEVEYNYCLINPRIVSSSVQKSYLENGEGCLSVKDEHQGHVVRSARIKVAAYDMLQDKEITIRAHGYLAIVLQHEIDHFSGTLFYDHIDPEDPFIEIEDAIVI